MKRNDCGEILTSENKTKRTRCDICDSCWDSRLILVKLAPTMQPELFRAIQRKMAYGRGTAKRLIDQFIGTERFEEVE